jgi:hypothetical protein
MTNSLSNWQPLPVVLASNEWKNSHMDMGIWVGINGIGHCKMGLENKKVY